jgi:hypothetical protein
MVEEEPALQELADLPLGWCANRSTGQGRWKREPNT